jgi:hypothetical protein
LQDTRVFYNTSKDECESPTRANTVENLLAIPRYLYGKVYAMKKRMEQNAVIIVLIALSIFSFLTRETLKKVQKDGLAYADTIATLRKDVDTLKQQNDLAWKYVFAVDSFQRDHLWLSYFKKDYKWVDDAIKDSIEAEELMRVELE